MLRALWTQQVVEFHGRWHHISHAGLNPLPVQRPIPIWFGVGSSQNPQPPETVLRRVARLADGLRLGGRILLAAGATRVMPPSLDWHQCSSPEDLARLERDVGLAGGLQLSSAHPQGGNALGEVVDSGFRVRDMANVYVCDASVFPTSLGVDPQLSVMAMARLAADTVS